MCVSLCVDRWGCNGKLGCGDLVAVGPVNVAGAEWVTGAACL